MELMAVVFAGLLVAVLITLTDDRVGPLGHADRISPPAARKTVWKISRRVVGMPSQVYLQNFGVRFIASCVPSLGALCRATAPPGRR